MTATNYIQLLSDNDTSDSTPACERPNDADLNYSKPLDSNMDEERGQDNENETRLDSPFRRHLRETRHLLCLAWPLVSFIFMDFKDQTP